MSAITSTTDSQKLRSVCTEVEKYGPFHVLPLEILEYIFQHSTQPTILMSVNKTFRHILSGYDEATKTYTINSLTMFFLNRFYDSLALTPPSSYPSTSVSCLFVDNINLQNRLVKEFHPNFLSQHPEERGTLTLLSNALKDAEFFESAVDRRLNALTEIHALTAISSLHALTNISYLQKWITSKEQKIRSQPPRLVDKIIKKTYCSNGTFQKTYFISTVLQHVSNIILRLVLFAEIDAEKEIENIYNQKEVNQVSDEDFRDIFKLAVIDKRLKTIKYMLSLNLPFFIENAFEEALKMNKSSVISLICAKADSKWRDVLIQKARHYGNVEALRLLLPQEIIDPKK